MALEEGAPRIVLTGKDGQVGFELQRALAPLGKLYAVGRADCDLADPAAIRAMLQATRPHIIVNSAAYSTVDAAETDRAGAFAVNAIAPAVMAEEAAKSGALLVHYSSDYIFDGRKQGPYLEQDAAAPLSVYGLSKLAGEQAIRACGVHHLILRTSWVFGVHGRNFLKTILRLAAERASLQVVADQVGAPTPSALIADVTADILTQYWHDHGRRDDPGRFGTFHLTAGGATSWHNYARLIVSSGRQMGMAMKLRPDQVRAVATDQYPLPARRPANSRLSTEKLSSAFDIVLPDWQAGVTDVLRQLSMMSSNRAGRPPQ